MKGEGMVLLGHRCPWALVVHGWGVVVSHVCQPLIGRGCPVCGRSSDVGGTSLLSMGGASSSIGYHGRVWGQIVISRWG